MLLSRVQIGHARILAGLIEQIEEREPAAVIRHTSGWRGEGQDPWLDPGVAPSIPRVEVDDIEYL